MRVRLLLFPLPIPLSLSAPALHLPLPYFLAYKACFAFWKHPRGKARPRLALSSSVKRLGGCKGGVGGIGKGLACLGAFPIPLWATLININSHTHARSTSPITKESQRRKTETEREREGNIYYISHIFIIFYLHFFLLLYFPLFDSTSFYLHFAFCARRKLKTRRAFQEDGRKLLQAAAGENKLKIFIAKIFAGKCQWKRPKGRAGHGAGGGGGGVSVCHALKHYIE